MYRKKKEICCIHPIVSWHTLSPMSATIFLSFLSFFSEESVCLSVADSLGRPPLGVCLTPPPSPFSPLSSHRSFLWGCEPTTKGRAGERAAFYTATPSPPPRWNMRETERSKIMPRRIFWDDIVSNECRCLTPGGKNNAHAPSFLHVQKI